MVIQVTDEMVAAFRATPGTGPWSTGDPDEGVRAGLTAAFGLVERDQAAGPLMATVRVEERGASTQVARLPVNGGRVLMPNGLIVSVDL